MKNIEQHFKMFFKNDNTSILSYHSSKAAGNNLIDMVSYYNHSITGDMERQAIEANEKNSSIFFCVITGNLGYTDKRLDIFVRVSKLWMEAWWRQKYKKFRFLLHRL